MISNLLVWRITSDVMILLVWNFPVFAFRMAKDHSRAFRFRSNLPSAGCNRHRR